MYCAAGGGGGGAGGGGVRRFMGAAGAARGGVRRAARSALRAEEHREEDARVHELTWRVVGSGRLRQGAEAVGRMQVGGRGPRAGGQEQGGGGGRGRGSTPTRRVGTARIVSSAAPAAGRGRYTAGRRGGDGCVRSVGRDGGGDGAGAGVGGGAGGGRGASSASGADEGRSRLVRRRSSGKVLGLLVPRVLVRVQLERLLVVRLLDGVGARVVPAVADNGQAPRPRAARGGLRRPRRASKRLRRRSGVRRRA